MIVQSWLLTIVAMDKFMNLLFVRTIVQSWMMNLYDMIALMIATEFDLIEW
jgi:hypothetical protein